MRCFPETKKINITLSSRSNNESQTNFQDLKNMNWGLVPGCKIIRNGEIPERANVKIRRCSAAHCSLSVDRFYHAHSLCYFQFLQSDSLEQARLMGTQRRGKCYEKEETIRWGVRPEDRNPTSSCMRCTSCSTILRGRKVLLHAVIFT